MLLNDLIDIQKIGIKSIEPALNQTTINGRDIVAKQSSQKWSFTVTTGVMRETEMLALASMIVRQSGSYGEFQFKIETGQNNVDKSDGVVSVAALTGADAVSINAHGYVPIGSFLKFSNHTKIYQVYAFNGTSFSFYPALTVDVPLATTITFDQPIATVRNANDMDFIELSEYDIAQKYDITLVEVI